MKEEIQMAIDPWKCGEYYWHQGNGSLNHNKRPHNLHRIPKTLSYTVSGNLKNGTIF